MLDVGVNTGLRFSKKLRANSTLAGQQTRILAREQFLKNALIKKIARGMGLIEDTQR
jgi:hypothetical protein